MTRLRRTDPGGPGIARRRAGKGFAYRWPDGRPVREADVLARIDALAVPPAWEDVWISPHPNGHIQAVGTDARGRRQYRYHDEWRRRRDLAKFERMEQFAAALPAMRAAVSTELDDPGDEPLRRERVLATAVRLLDLGFFRIGGEAYAEANGSFGLATMQKRHVRVDRRGVVTFSYTAKAAKERLQTVVDPSVAAVVRSLRRRPGSPEDDLLAYRRDGRWCDIRSADVNAYLKEVAGDEFTAKDFRTWSATVLASVALAVSTGATSPTARKRAIRRAVCEVSDYLGNTPTVCRTAYIDPRVAEAYLEGDTIRPALDRLGEGAAFGQLATQGPIEEAVRRLLARRGSAGSALAA